MVTVSPFHYPFCLSSDGHTDKDIILKWKNPTIQISNKEMAQFSVGNATLSTEVNTFITGKDVITREAVFHHISKHLRRRELKIRRAAEYF